MAIKSLKKALGLLAITLLLIAQTAFAQSIGGLDGIFSNEMLSNLFLLGVSILFFISGVYYLTRKHNDRTLNWE